MKPSTTQLVSNVRGDVTTNTVEGYFGILTCGLKGVYQHVSPAHLHRYVSEFSFRYNNRVALDIDDRERCRVALEGISGKRLTYKGSAQSTRLKSQSREAYEQVMEILREIDYKWHPDEF